MTSAPPPLPPGHASAVFAGGCFWCMQPPFDETAGVLATYAGYCGGHLPNPSYEQVCAGGSGHLESVLVIYDPQRVSYAELIEVFWRSIDPTQGDGQFADRAGHYLSAIFVADDEQRQIAEAAKATLAESGIFNRPIATQILAAAPFYLAEDYHQHYYRKQVAHYQAYKEGSGRGPFLRRVWSKV
ncbi:MAG: peptide-methionine (S)-S-oxide reductase [Planctomycetota bacterium]|nr:MAG: peptide-methionine (S)-S-oxide reductase [Planctomycetota bacterium]